MRNNNCVNIMLQRGRDIPKVHVRRRNAQRFRVVSVANVSLAENPETGAFFAEFETSIIRHASNDGQRSGLLLSSHTFHLHI